MIVDGDNKFNVGNIVWGVYFVKYLRGEVWKVVGRIGISLGEKFRLNIYSGVISI